MTVVCAVRFSSSMKGSERSYPPLCAICFSADDRNEGIVPFTTFFSRRRSISNQPILRVTFFSTASRASRSACNYQ